MVIPARKKLFRGFTLIELLIVIAILGILAAAVLVAVNPKKRQDQAKDANIKADVGSIATGLQAYFTSPGQGSYPLTLLKLEENKDLVKVRQQLNVYLQAFLRHYLIRLQQMRYGVGNHQPVRVSL